MRSLLVLFWLLAWAAAAWAAPFDLADYGSDYPYFHGDTASAVCDKLRNVTWDLALVPSYSPVVDVVLEPFGTFSDACVLVDGSGTAVDYFGVYDAALNGGYQYPDERLVFSLGTYNAGGATVTFPDFFNLSPAQGAELGSAIALVWAVAWAFRVLIKMVKDTSDVGRSESD